MAKRRNKQKLKLSSRRLIVSLLVLALFAGGFFYGLKYENKIDELLGLRTVEVYNPGDMVRIGGLGIHFIDVGQGDACLIELPDDKSVLIDAGDKSAKSKLSQYIEEVNQDRELQDRPQIEYFDYVIATHSDADHVGSLAHILSEYPAAVFYRPNEESTREGFTDPANSGEHPRNQFWGENSGEKNTLVYKEAIQAGYAPHDNFIEAIVTNPHDDLQNCISPDSTYPQELSYEINFYGPVKSYYTDHNDYSPIIIVEYKGRRIALSGDCEKTGEADFVKMVSDSDSSSRYYALKSGSFDVDIVKLGHHGSRTSSSEAYLNLLISSPSTSFVIISCGEGNSYGHPHPEVLERINSLGFSQEKIRRTDLEGDLYFSLNLYEENPTALVEQHGGVPIIEVKYKLLGELSIGGKQLNDMDFLFNPFPYVQIRYRLLGGLILIILALILLPIGFIKKANKKVKKSKR